MSVQAHVLVAPTEQFIPDRDPSSGIFERDQALAVRTLGIRVGALSVASPFPLWPAVKRLARDVREGTSPRSSAAAVTDSIGAIVRRGHLELRDGIPVSTVSQPRVLFRQSEEQLDRDIRALERAYDAYVDRHGRPDVLHAHNAVPSGAFAQRLRSRTGIPYVLTEHSTAFGRGVVPAELHPTIRRAYRDAESTIVVSPSLGAVLMSLGLTSQWTWVPNVIGPEFVNSKLSNPPDGPITFLNVAALEPKKGHRTLIEAFAAVVRRVDTFIRLRIAGRGPEGAAISQAIDQLGMSGHIEMLGGLSRREVAEELNRSHALVIASDVETFGVAGIEALAMGRPVIATRSGGPEHFVNGSNGQLVPPGDVNALAGALEALIAAPGSYDPIELRRSALARYGPVAIGQQLIELYNAALAGY